LLFPLRGTATRFFKAILEAESTPAVRLNPDVSAELERIINKALEKDRDLRHQSAAEVGADLKRLKRETDSRCRPSSSSKAIPVVSESPAQATGPPPRVSDQGGREQQSQRQPLAHGSVQTTSGSAVATVKKHMLGATAGVIVALVILCAASMHTARFPRRFRISRLRRSPTRAKR
jgi:hypothetical protein